MMSEYLIRDCPKDAEASMLWQGIIINSCSLNKWSFLHADWMDSNTVLAKQALSPSCVLLKHMTV